MAKFKKSLKIIIPILLAVIILALPLSRGLWSMAVMGVYSKMNERESILSERGVDVRIPGGLSTKERDWYPFVMTFNADGGFSNYIGREDTRLTIMYNFPAFDLAKGCSRLYDEESPLYSSFYGAYAVSTADGTPYGFKAEDAGLVLDEDVTALVPEYDYHRLVLRDFGLRQKDAEFEWVMTHREDDVTYLGYDGWTAMDADLRVNGCAHKPDGFVQSYLQYGSCEYDAKDPLGGVDMYGRVYCRYFAEQDLSIFMYVLTADKAELERCDREILSKSKIVEK